MDILPLTVIGARGYCRLRDIHLSLITFNSIRLTLQLVKALKHLFDICSNGIWHHETWIFQMALLGQFWYVTILLTITISQWERFDRVPHWNKKICLLYGEFHTSDEFVVCCAEPHLPLKTHLPIIATSFLVLIRLVNANKLTEWQWEWNIYFISATAFDISLDIKLPMMCVNALLVYHIAGINLLAPGKCCSNLKV